MAKPSSAPLRRRILWLLVALAAAFGLALLVIILTRGRPSPTSMQAVVWARLGTTDAHSLAFAPGSTENLFFGYHFGILESADGGRTWQSLGTGRDAMEMAVGDGTTIYIAGHNVFQLSRDGGRTWQSPSTDLPGLDIHGFTRDPADSTRMWAYLATGGVFESTDNGSHWRLVYDGAIPLLTAVESGGQTRLLGLDGRNDLVMSVDAGSTWTVVATPRALSPVSLAATPAGNVVLMGAQDGLYRSDDSGSSWRRILDVPLPLAVAVSLDGTVVAAVDSRTDFYRSGDRGATWPGP